MDSEFLCHSLSQGCDLIPIILKSFKHIAFFDFDGTITTSDTMLELIRFHFGKSRFYSGMITLSPQLAAMKCGLISRQRAKEKLLTHFFGGMGIERFDAICLNFCRYRLPDLVRKEAWKKIMDYKAMGTEVVIVTASASYWISPWSEQHELPLIASELEKQDGHITGRLIGKNCNYQEKVRRIRESYTLDDYDEIHCYGDSKGDKAMLMLATHSFYKKF